MSCCSSLLGSLQTGFGRLNLIMDTICGYCFFGRHSVFLPISSIRCEVKGQLTSTFLATWILEVMMALPPAAPPTRIGLPSFSTMYGQLELKGRFRPFTIWSAKVILSYEGAPYLSLLEMAHSRTRWVYPRWRNRPLYHSRPVPIWEP